MSEGASPAQPRRWWIDRVDRPLVAITLLGLIYRMVYDLVLHKPVDFDYSDMDSYMSRARQLADPFYRSTAGDFYYPGGTATFLSAALRLFGEHTGWTVNAVLQVLLSTACIPLLYIAVRRWFGRSAALWSCGLYAFHFLAVSYSGFFMSETYLTVALVAGSALLVPKRPELCLLAGVVLGLGAWAKSQAILLVILWAMLLLWQRRFRAALVLALGGFGVVVPISVYVSMKSGHPVYMSNNGGQTFALGHCPFKSIRSRNIHDGAEASFEIPTVAQKVDRGAVEATWQDGTFRQRFENGPYYMKVGMECITRFPGLALKYGFVHLADTFAGVPWSPVSAWPDEDTDFHWPTVITNNLISYLVAPLAFLGIWWRRRDVGTHYLVSLPLFSLLASAFLFHGDPRFRAPYDYCLFIGAAMAVQEMFRRSSWSRKRLDPSLFSGHFGLLGEP